MPSAPFGRGLLELAGENFTRPGERIVAVIGRRWSDDAGG